MDGLSPIDLTALSDGPTFVEGFTADGSGNLYLLGPAITETPSQQIIKLDAELATVWATQLPVASGSTVALNTAKGIAATASGEVYYAGDASVPLAGETAGGGQDIFLGKLGSNGDAAWAHQFGGSGDEAEAFLRIATDGSALVYGTSSGQLPQQPASAAKGVFAVNYSADGVRGWTHQLDSGRPSLLAVDVDPSGAAYGVDVGGSQPAAFKLGADGSELWTGLALKGLPSLASGSQPFHVAAAADGGYFSFHGYYPTCFLARWSADGDLLWYRASARRDVVIDDVEGVIWHGAFRECSALAVSSDRVYLAGYFENSYENGSSVRSSTYPLFVGSYDLAGEQKWFRLLNNPGEGGLGPVYLVLDSNAQPVLATSTAIHTYVARFNAPDGALL